MTDELAELRALYADDPVVLAAIDRQIAQGRADAAEGRRYTKYARVSCGVNVNRIEGVKGGDEVHAGATSTFSGNGHHRLKRTR